MQKSESAPPLKLNLFFGCPSLTSFTANMPWLKDARHMFDDCPSLNPKPQLPIVGE